ncbi:TPA: hypothetical protein R9Y97_003423 [Bacillus cereus]|nr:hypothetical protein [Bacillus cereus]
MKNKFEREIADLKRRINEMIDNDEYDEVINAELEDLGLYQNGIDPYSPEYILEEIKKAREYQEKIKSMESLYGTEVVDVVMEYGCEPEQAQEFLQLEKKFGEEIAERMIESDSQILIDNRVCCRPMNTSVLLELMSDWTLKPIENNMEALTFYLRLEENTGTDADFQGYLRGKIDELKERKNLSEGEFAKINLQSYDRFYDEKESDKYTEILLREVFKRGTEINQRLFGI